MSCGCNNNGNNNGYGGNQNFVRQLYRYIGETVTIFTASGGPSGGGFTGVLLSVNYDYVRLVTQQGSAPTSPLNCDCDTACHGMNFGTNDRNGNNYVTGSVCDIPIDTIVSFCHNAI